MRRPARFRSRSLSRLIVSAVACLVAAPDARAGQAEFAWAAYGGYQSAGLGASVGFAGDVNGDGYDDVFVGIGAGYFGVFHGSAAGLPPSPNWVSEQLLFGSYALGSPAGDVNGDGYDDFVVSHTDGFSYYAGSASGLSPTSVRRLSGRVVATGAGDPNGDGYDDIVVGQPEGPLFGSQEGAVFLFAGSPSGPSVDPVWTVLGSRPNEKLGTSVAAAGDVDGDGRDDIVVGVPFGFEADPDALARVYFGAHGYFANTSRSLAATEPSSGAGRVVAGAGDVDADGYADLLATGGTGAVRLYRGSRQGPSATWQNIPGTSSYSALASAGDVDGDGHDDVILGFPEAANPEFNEGLVVVHRGTATGLASVPHLEVELDQQQAKLGAAVGGGGDGNGDGYADAIVGAPGFQRNNTNLRREGAAFLYLGSAAGLACPDADGDGFGEPGYPQCPGGLQSDCNGANPHCSSDCTNADGDGYCVTTDCDDADPQCFANCGDADGDGLCADRDCYDLSPACTSNCTGDADGDGVPTCGDCADTNPSCSHDCADADGDGYCADADCNDALPFCTTSCVDADGDGYCAAHDCFDGSAACTTACVGDADGDGVPTCGDCNDASPNCRANCTDADGDGYCVDVDCLDTNAACRVAFDCVDADGDGVNNCVDCNPSNQYCSTDCTDNDHDGYCVTRDCYDFSSNCVPTIACDDFDFDGVPDCGDCAPGNPLCTTNCADPDGDLICDDHDLCPLDPANDVDSDGACASADNCPSVSNPTQADFDSDGSGDVCDNCPFDGNASQTDNDGDGSGDACDCAPSDPAIRSAAEVMGLAIEKIGSAIVRLSWSATPGAATYAVIRAELATLSAAEVGDCLVGGLVNLTWDDGELPAPNAGFSYLVRGDNPVCGPGPLGFGALGFPRPPASSACP